jgi:cyclophilin family peptidyl-prolyl cis-trans isomerase
MKKIISGIAILLSAVISVDAQTQQTTISAAPADKATTAAAGDKIVEITTDMGTMKVKLYNETPLHRDNFVKLASEGFYNGLLFHRVISGFMIQGGDPNSKTAAPDAMLGSGDVGYKVPAEIKDNLYHKKGTLCAARDNNPEKASSGCQFYIVQGKPMTAAELDQYEARIGYKFTPQQRKDYTTIGGTPFLDRNYTVFGEVIEGMDVIDKIAAVKTKPGDRPEADVKMTVKVIQ